MAVFLSNNQTFTADIQGDLVSQSSPSRAAVYGKCNTYVAIKYPYETMMKVLRVGVLFDGVQQDLLEVYTYPVLQGAAIGSQAVEFAVGNVVNEMLKRGVTMAQLVFKSRYYDQASFDDDLVVEIEPYEGIPYSDALAPYKHELPFATYAVLRQCVIPPNVMFVPSVNLSYGTSKPYLYFESNIHTLDKSMAWKQERGGVEQAIPAHGRRDNYYYVDWDATAVILHQGDTVVKRWELEVLPSCQPWALVRWVSQTGAVRQHYFPIVSFGNEDAEKVGLVSVANGFRTQKNFVKTAKCRITGLTAYGCWYYQDLLTASDVHAIVVKRGNTFNFEIESQSTAVEIAGGMKDTPEGVGFFNFEFTIKMAHYDTY